MKNCRKSVILNLNCKGGKGLKYWKKISPFLEKSYGPLSIHVSADKAKSIYTMKNLLFRGQRTFISAGGDGCVNLLINTIIANKKQIPLSDFTIGALGLGSSNDFHKPVVEKIQNVPVRLNDEKPILRDVGEIVYLDKSNKQKKIYFLISSSAGIVAEGNENFNQGGPFLNFLKKRFTQLAIFWTFFQTLRSFRNIPLKLKVDDKEVLNLDVSYLAVSKTPYISGMFHFDEMISRNDGRFLVKILHDCSRIDLIRCMLKLMNGREEGIPNLVTRFVKTLEVSSRDPFVLECDGETQTTTKSKFQMYKEMVKECT
jgi:diacylglycerol kinase family enzyme